MHKSGLVVQEKRMLTIINESTFFIVIILTFWSVILNGIPHYDLEIPQITTQWLGSSNGFTIKNSHLEEYPIFRFNVEDLYQYKLPTGPITFGNNPHKAVLGNILAQLIEKLIQELHEHKKEFTDFVVLQNKNYNGKLNCGLIVLKFKEYPFVLKLFIELPETFANPFGKGIEQMCFFYMAGGANRHITGLTRIKNAIIVNNKIATLPQWAGCVETPRKWLWMPNQLKWLEIIGHNIGGKKEIRTILPSIYAIVADAIDMQHQYKMPTKQKKHIVMQLCNDLDVFIDPHYNNFTFLPNTNPLSTNTRPYKIIIVDTEHFPTIVGLKKKKSFRNHHSWYLYLGSKCFKDTFLRTKRERRYAQIAEHELALV
jgi:hypothetical protein